MKLRYTLCPHWYKTPPNTHDAVMMDVVKRKQCRICGKHRIHAKVPKPHPSRNKQSLLRDLQQPGFELVVDEWLPYGEREL